MFKRKCEICFLSVHLFRVLLCKVILKPAPYCTNNKRLKREVQCLYLFIFTDLSKKCQSCQIKLYGFVFPLYLYYTVLLQLN